MRIALLADIHANRQAFSACLAHARDNGAEQFALLGDYVGYGADPDWTVTEVMDLVSRGAAAVLGNHDCAVGDSSVELNLAARIVIEWTRGELGHEQRRFLAALPLTLERQGRLFVHAEASRPASWTYVTGADDAKRSMRATSADVTFCGHVHRPALYTLSPAGRMTAFTPTAGVSVQLLPGRQWLAVLGSVGQPRDHSAAASYAMLDAAAATLTYHRVPYDVEQAAARIRQQGLPAWLADRLYLGR
ncbi:metallophosphoesterase family protein [Bradyrhizobium sp. 2TAF24]|uniref:metallophosphoesterase family protein n=1 Tax=Bradyrhizobium sp. 2TAF24 TaxID=3233011 RepID=UPI003F900187